MDIIALGIGIIISLPILGLIGFLVYCAYKGLVYIYYQVRIFIRFIKRRVAFIRYRKANRYESQDI